jgi:predicted nucleic acid-binding protein
MLYLDTSILVAAVSREAATERVQAWLADQLEPVALSDWSVLEFASAVAAKQRGGDLNPVERVSAIHWLARLQDETAPPWPINRVAFRRAVELINITGIKVRAADALHLAIAEERGVTLCTLDEEQAKAGEAAAISTFLI